MSTRSSVFLKFCEFCRYDRELPTESALFLNHRSICAGIPMVGKPLSSRTSHILVSASNQEIGSSSLLTVALHTIIFAWLKNKVGSHLVRPVVAYTRLSALCRTSSRCCSAATHLAMDTRWTSTRSAPATCWTVIRSPLAGFDGVF